MGKSSQPAMNQVLRVMRHLTEVVALRHDPPAQHQLLIDGLSAIFHANVGWFVVFDDFHRGGLVRSAIGAIRSDSDPHWVKYCADFAVHIHPEDDPFADFLLTPRFQEIIVPRKQVLHNLGSYRRYSSAVDIIQQAGIGDGTVASFRTESDPKRLVALSLHRSADDPDLTDRENMLLCFTLAEVRRLVDRGHLVLNEAAVAPLPPRLRQVLDRLLLGQSPKAIAHALSLSIWTVREHMQRLYAHYGVNSREELMARYVGRPKTPTH